MWEAVRDTPRRRKIRAQPFADRSTSLRAENFAPSVPQGSRLAAEMVKFPSNAESVDDDGSERRPVMQLIEGVIYVPKAKCTRDKLVEFDDAVVHVLIHHARQLGATFDAAKRRPAPDASSYKHEGPSLYLLACAGNAYDAALPPALVARLQGRCHGFGLADAFERVVETAVKLVDQDLLNGFVVVFGADAVCCSHLLCVLELLRVGVDGDDF
mmetsp:Transcript_10232/g.31254  ORF Transcript_10232/g.31254 Transcript_10232/m.31254 type:complete len:213 (-) Transcript_10232:751-1389(-)